MVFDPGFQQQQQKHWKKKNENKKKKANSEYRIPSNGEILVIECTISVFTN